MAEIVALVSQAGVLWDDVAAVSAQDDLEQFAKAHGFADAAEFINISAGLDYSRPGIVFAYEVWKQHDGTKAGLLRLIEASQKKL